MNFKRQTFVFVEDKNYNDNDDQDLNNSLTYILWVELETVLTVRNFAIGDIIRGEVVLDF